MVARPDCCGNSNRRRDNAPEGTRYAKPFPTETSGASGQQYWRDTAVILNRAGFDVLMLDRRGIGISGGYSDTNTLQQGRDLLTIVASLRSGEGLRALSPTGDTRKGREAAEAVRGAKPEDGLPVVRQLARHHGHGLGHDAQL